VTATGRCLGGQVRLKTTSVAVTRWLLAALHRCVAAPASAVSEPRPGGVCFGPMSERDELALKGLVAGDDRAADGLRWEIGDGDLGS
jgi:hypothetical protein